MRQQSKQQPTMEASTAPSHNELHAVLSALLAGARYGIKIRLPHAFVMTFLFRRNLSTTKKLQGVAKLVREHATNLAAFAASYKLILAVLKLVSKLPVVMTDSRIDLRTGANGTWCRLERLLKPMFGTEKTG